MTNEFVDKNCTVTHNGKSFTSGGAWIRRSSAGYVGLVYANDRECFVSNWDGTIQVPAKFGKVWRSNFGDLRRTVRFIWHGVPMGGTIYACDWNMAVKVRQSHGRKPI